MLRRTSTATVLVATLLVATTAVAAHHATHRRHVPGCWTHSCDRRVGRWLARWEAAHAPLSTAVASFYDDAGGTACGSHYTYGFAHLGPGESAEGWTPALGGLACGTRVRICAARCVTATMQDHGPYVYGREFDLNRTLKEAIGAGDTGEVRYRVLG